MRTIVCAGIVLVVLSAVSACKRVPEHVIPPDDMAELLADRHIAEAVVDYNAQQWRTDSQRMALRDAVYARYGATQADVDTSLDWYGHHLARYMEVYDRTIEILEARVASSDTRLRADQSLTIAGDSVDVWPDSRFFAIGRLSPGRAVSFTLNADENRERGDYYTWRAKFANNQHEATWTVVAEYADSTLEYVAERVNGGGWHEITLQTDSSRTAVRVYGSLLLAHQGRGPQWLDSVSLVRNHLRPDTYNRRFRQRIIRK